MPAPHLPDVVEREDALQLTAPHLERSAFTAATSWATSTPTAAATWLQRTGRRFDLVDGGHASHRSTIRALASLVSFAAAF